MHTVRSILDAKGRDVAAIDSEASVLDAALSMNERHIGSLVVTQGQKVVGIFTERDVMNRVVARELDAARTRVREVMTAPVAVCTIDTTRDECRSVMRKHRIRHLPVVDNERLIGIVSIGDILTDQTNEQDETIHYLYEYMIGEWRELAPVAS